MQVGRRAGPSPEEAARLTAQGLKKEKKPLGGRGVVC
jgi:hypothetical protein